MARGLLHRNPRLRFSLGTAAFLCLAAAGAAQCPPCCVTLSPASLTVAPGQTSRPVTVQVDCPGQDGLYFNVWVTPDLPGKPRGEPPEVAVIFPPGETTASATFRLTTTTATRPGVYTVAVVNDFLGLSATLTLTVEEPRGSLDVQPPGVTALPGETTAPLLLRLSDTNLSGVALRFGLVLPEVLAGHVTLQPAPVLLSVPAGGSGGSAPFQLQIGSEAPPGLHSLRLDEAGTGLRASFTLRVEPSRTRLSVAPGRVSVPPGRTGPRMTLHVESASLAGVPLAFEAEWPAALQGHAALDPARLAVTVPEGGGSARTVFRVLCGPEAPPGTWTVRLSDREHRLRAAFDLEIPPLGGLAELVPRSVSLHPGGTSAPLTLRVSGAGLSGISLAFEARMPPELSGRCRTTPAPVGVTVPAGASEAAATFEAACSPDAPSGRYPVEMAEPRFGLRASFDLEIGALPRIVSVIPGSVAAGTVSLVVRLQGSGFQPGAAVSSPSPLLSFGSSRVLAAELAETTVSVRSDAPPGPYRLDLANPDGGRTRDGATLLVHPTGDLSALGVRTAAIVHPLPGALLAAGEALHPLGLLATTGSGSVVGIWLLDGVPFDRFVIRATGGLPVQVRSGMPIPPSTLGQHRLELAIEAPQSLVSAPVTVTRVQDRADRFRLLAPAEGARLLPGPFRFRWTPVPGTEGYEIEVFRDRGGAGAPALRRRVPMPLWTPGERDFEEMTPGPWLWRVRPLFAGGVTGPFSAPRSCLFLPREVRLSRLAVRYLPPWRPGGGGSGVALAFGLLSVEWALSAQEPEPAPAAGEPPPSWLVSANGIFSQAGGDGLPDPPLNGTLALSGQVDRAGGSSLLGGTGSLSYNRAWPGGAPPQENRNWLLHGSREMSAAVHNAGGQAGYVTPSVVFGSELMTIGLNKGGTEATLALPGDMALSYFETFDAAAAGMASGVLGSRETLQAGSLAGAVGGIKLKAVGLEVDKTGSEFTPGSRGSIVGLLASWEGARLQAFFEGARSDAAPDPESFETERQGEAWRLRLSGTWAGWNGTATLGRTGAGFGNPANQGLTAAGGADQSNAVVSLGRAFGDLALALNYQYAEGGAVDTRLDGGDLTLTAPLGRRVTLTLGGNLSTTRGDAVEEWGLPESRVESRGGTLSLAESLGGTSLGQTLTWQETQDRHDPARWSDVTEAGLTAMSTPWPRLGLSAQARATRTRDSFGTTESLLATLEPTWTLPSQSLVVRPYASFARNRSDLQPGATETEVYRLILTWSPGWLRSLLTLEGGSDWSRTRTAGLSEEGFVRTYTFALALRRDRP